MARPPTPPQVVRYLDTATAYDLWSEVYDTDGNFLQGLDTIEMRTLLPRLLSMIERPKPWKIVDLGCGTGRNTLQLLSLADTEVVGMDLSPGMLRVACERLQTEAAKSGITSSFQLEVFDMLSSSEVPTVALSADAVISTLVVEHIPLDVYFATIAKILKPGGLLLVTNMHSEMGKISQAGFVDPKTGEKLRPVSFTHTTGDVLSAASEQGLELVGEMNETAIDTALAQVIGPRAQKWIGVTVWFGGILRKRML